jgi:hypothetical protein
VNPETTEELLSRMEREHVPCPGNGSAEPHNEHCMEDWGAPWPCDSARLVAHIRSLEAALTKIAESTHAWESDAVADALHELGDPWAALGEAQ